MRNRIANIVAVIRLFLLTTFVYPRQDRADARADNGLRIKAAKIRRVFQREVNLIAGSLSHTVIKVCTHPGRCALGALLAAAGVPDADLSGRGIPGLAWFTLLTDTYGITQVEARSLLDANDREDGPLWAACGLTDANRYKGTIEEMTTHRDGIRACVVNSQLANVVGSAEEYGTAFAR